MRRTWLGSVLSLCAVGVVGSLAYSDPPKPPDEFEQQSARSHPLNLVVNGSFESRQEGEPPVNLETLPPGNAGLSGWEIIDSPTSNEVPAPRSTDWVGPDRWKASHGQYCLDIDGGIRQWVPTAIGTEYELRFDFASNPELGPPPQQLRVLIDDHSTEFGFEDPAGNTGNLRWTTRFVRFTATNEKTTLTFLNLVPNVQSAGIALDRVEIIPAEPIPEVEALAGEWTIEFANGVKEGMELTARGGAKVVEPLRTANGRATHHGRGVVIAFEDDRVERWTTVGKRVVVEHWFPAKAFPAGDPVLGIGERVPASP